MSRARDTYGMSGQLTNHSQCTRQGPRAHDLRLSFRVGQLVLHEDLTLRSRSKEPRAALPLSTVWHSEPPQVPTQRLEHLKYVQ